MIIKERAGSKLTRLGSRGVTSVSDSHNKLAVGLEKASCSKGMVGFVV